MVRRSWLDRVEGFDEDLRQAEDWDMWLRLAHAGCPMAWIRKPVCIYRLHRNSMTADATAHKRYLLLMLDKFFQQPGLPESLRSIEQRTFARMYLQGAVREYRVGQYDDAREDVARAFEIIPAHERSGLQEFFFQLVVAWAGHPLTPDPYDYIHQVLDHLPDNAADLSRNRRMLFARYSMSQFFQAYERDDWPRVRSMFAKSVVNDVSWLRNRGVWSIMGTAIVGPRVAQNLRTFIRPVGGDSRT
jgi:hypothetical protein